MSGQNKTIQSFNYEQHGFMNFNNKYKKFVILVVKQYPQKEELINLKKKKKNALEFQMLIKF
jgi:hypothetical protein